MDRGLLRLARLSWFVYRRHEVAISILKRIETDIISYRIRENWRILSKKKWPRRSYSLPNLHFC